MTDKKKSNKTNKNNDNISMDEITNKILAISTTKSDKKPDNSTTQNINEIIQPLAENICKPRPYFYCNMFTGFSQKHGHH